MAVAVAAPVRVPPAAFLGPLRALPDRLPPLLAVLGVLAATAALCAVAWLLALHGALKHVGFVREAMGWGKSKQQRLREREVHKAEIQRLRRRSATLQEAPAPE